MLRNVSLHKVLGKEELYLTDRQGRIIVFQNETWSEGDEREDIPVKDELRKVGIGLALKRHVCLVREFELYHTGNGKNQRKF